jgi:hypothetical protein
VNSTRLLGAVGSISCVSNPAARYCRANSIAEVASLGFVVGCAGDHDAGVAHDDAIVARIESHG